jgi:hypothetical protein
MATLGTVTAPSLTGSTNQNEWWKTGTGLIGSVTNANAANTTGTGYTANNANAANYTGTGYTANSANAASAGNASQGSFNNAGLTNWNVDSNQLVDSQVGRIIDNNSPLMQQAVTRAQQGMAKRGLLNSSMATGAAQSALYDAAMPMAQQNATTYANAANTNAGAANQNAQFNATGNANMSQFNVGQSNNMAQYNAGNQQQANLANQNAQNQAAEYGATATNQANAANAQFGQQTNLANQNAQNEAAQFGANATNTANLNNANFSQQANLTNAQAANAAQQQSNDLRQKAAQGDQAAQLEMAKQDLTNKMQASIQNADAQTKAYLTELDGQIKSGLANIEANYKTLMQTSQSAGDMYKDVVSRIAAIAADPNMDAASKTSTINAMQNYLTNGMNVIGSINGINLSNLLVFE